MAQGAVQRPVFVFTTAADRVAGGNQEIQAGLVQFRNKAPLRNMIVLNNELKKIK